MGAKVIARNIPSEASSEHHPSRRILPVLIVPVSPF